MKIIPFSKIAKSDICVYDIIAMRQTGKMFREYRYMQTPRPNSALILILSDDIVFSPMGKDSVRPKTGDVLYLPEGSHYIVQFGSDNSRTVLINFNITNRSSQNVVLTDNICFCPNSPDVQTLFNEIADIYTDKVENKLILKSKMYELLNLIAASGDFETSPVARAIDYINNHLTTEFSVADIARFAAMSESTFRREFRLATGTSPVKYITHEKLKKARQLLRSSNLPVSEISLSLGFYDTAHFCKTFKEVFGMTPAQYKKDFFK